MKLCMYTHGLTRVLFWCLFPLLLRNSGNKHQNNPLVSAETFRHSSTYIILYIFNELVEGTTTNVCLTFNKATRKNKVDHITTLKKILDV